METPASSLKEEEEAILYEDQEGPTFSWLRSAIPDLLSTSAIISEDLDVLFDHHLSNLITNSTEETAISHAGWEACGVDGCDRRVGPTSSRFDCPACSRVYCSTHAGHPSLQISRPDGSWQRVCDGCWRERHGQTSAGSTRSLLAEFEGKRAQAMGKRREARQLIERRLGKLEQIRQAKFGKDEERQLQRRLIQWALDETASNCPFCK